MDKLVHGYSLFISSRVTDLNEVNTDYTYFTFSSIL